MPRRARADAEAEARCGELVHLLREEGGRAGHRGERAVQLFALRRMVHYEGHDVMRHMWRGADGRAHPLYATLERGGKAAEKVVRASARGGHDDAFMQRMMAATGISEWRGAPLASAAEGEAEAAEELALALLAFHRAVGLTYRAPDRGKRVHELTSAGAIAHLTAIDRRGALVRGGAAAAAAAASPPARRADAIHVRCGALARAVLEVMLGFGPGGAVDLRRARALLERIL